jgi:hypothetical protein
VKGKLNLRARDVAPSPPETQNGSWRSGRRYRARWMCIHFQPSHPSARENQRATVWSSEPAPPGRDPITAAISSLPPSRFFQTTPSWRARRESTACSLFSARRWRSPYVVSCVLFYMVGQRSDPGPSGEKPDEVSEQLLMQFFGL